MVLLHRFGGTMPGHSKSAVADKSLEYPDERTERI
jgi:hypothetical protein